MEEANSPDFKHQPVILDPLDLTTSTDPSPFPDAPNLVASMKFVSAPDGFFFPK
jgi:hypothetical protein